MCPAPRRPGKLRHRPGEADGVRGARCGLVPRDHRKLIPAPALASVTPYPLFGVTEDQAREALRATWEGSGADCLVVDPWNALGTGQVFAYVSEVVALRA